MNESSRICAGAKKRNRTSTGVTPLEPESKGQFPSEQEQRENKQERDSQGGQQRSPETIQGQRPKGNPKDGRTCDQSDPTVELDRAIIRRALDVLQAWDEWSKYRVDQWTQLSTLVESLRDSLAAAGYLDPKVGSNG